MGYDEILTEERGRVGVVTLNRPEKLNAMTDTMLGEVGRQIQAWNDDDSVGAVVITGAGRGFCSGGDVSRFEEALHHGEGAVSPILESDWIDVIVRSKPVICAINGVAVGIGATMTLPCDIRVASEEARISFRFIRIGLTPELASTHYLANLVGLGLATELMLTGEPVDAERARSIGLVNHVYPADRMLEEAIVLAQGVAELPDWHLRQIKRLVHGHYTERDTGAVQSAEAEVFRKAMASEAHREALTAFREKRRPRFH